MSVYGGFLTKKQSLQYFSTIQQIIQMMQLIVIDSLHKNHVDYLQFRNTFISAYRKINKMEERKYMQPKYSITLKPLFTICYDHLFFINPNHSTEDKQVKQQKIQDKRYSNTLRSVNGIKQSINFVSKSLQKSFQNPFNEIQLKFQPKTFRLFRQYQLLPTTTTIQQNVLSQTLSQRPNTIDLTKRNTNKPSFIRKYSNTKQEMSYDIKTRYKSLQKKKIIVSSRFDHDNMLLRPKFNN